MHVKTSRSETDADFLTMKRRQCTSGRPFLFFPLGFYLCLSRFPVQGHEIDSGQSPHAQRRKGRGKGGSAGQLRFIIIGIWGQTRLVLLEAN